MQLPAVNLNGTSGKGLFDLNLAVVDHLRSAIDALAAACPNGRDYQTADDGAYPKAIEEHHDRMKRLEGVYAEMQALVESLADYA